MGRQSRGKVGSEENESFSIVVDACQFDHAVVVVEQLRRQFGAADENYYQVLVPQSKHPRKLDIKSLLVVLHAQSFFFVELHRCQMNLYSFVFPYSLELLRKTSLPSFEAFHQGVISLPHAFLQSQPQQLPLEKSLNCDCALTQGPVFIADTAHSPKGDNAVHRPRLTLLSRVFAASHCLRPNRQA